MNEPIQPDISNFTDLADALRERLEHEFEAIHRRRRWNRRVARVSAVASLSCFAGIALLWNAGFWQGESNPRGPLAEYQNDPSAAINPAPVYSAIEVTDLSDDELRSLLVSTKADWFIAEIDGRPTAFPLNPARPNSTTPGAF